MLIPNMSLSSLPSFPMHHSLQPTKFATNSDTSTEAVTLVNASVQTEVSVIGNNENGSIVGFRKSWYLSSREEAELCLDLRVSSDKTQTPQEGTVGLLRGAEKFEPERGYKLSTYVYWWIKQAMIKAIARKSRLVRLPSGKSEMVAKVAQANNILSSRLRRKPTYDETAEVLNVKASTIRLVSEKSRKPISLDKVVTDCGHMTLQV
ncbi:hypothetical protein PHAVU_005G023100 [Phaseolus vulgaris]|uniref:RNA polymerase sigma-70 region 2 domain-containing protein n=1 Tax=Phaseolus vulgaris TaxID=3885 RepID=V7BSE9_PHAVU|nr:hypothetical protein PHAVU_005G023100g [Phaseolus vulgaris]ESW20884.1 hypothetical protein PHAVU_005G023100g [Phaseolus vulgaris]